MLSINPGLFTPTQRRILQLLSDGLPHTREELKACLSDDLAGDSAVWSHVSLLRKELTRHGYDVLCSERNGGKYRLVRLLAQDD